VHLHYAIILATIVTLAGCSRAPVITIDNRSTSAIANIAVSGSGFSERIDNIAAGAKTTLTVHPRGESGVRLAFDADGRHIDTGEQGYFEAGGGYRVSVIVEPDLKVSVSSQLRSY